MGVYQTVYLGPYVQCKLREQPREENIRCCPSNGCVMQMKSVPGETTFCPRCGGAIQRITRKFMAKSSVYNIGVDDLAVWENEGIAYFLSNHNNPGRDFRIEGGDDSCLAVLLLDHAADLRWFEQRYSKSIARIRETCDDVSVLWGLHIYHQ